MNGKERVITAMAGGKPDRIPIFISAYWDYWTRAAGADPFDYASGGFDKQVEIELNAARREGRRIVAVGTTTVRTLEQVSLWAEEAGGIIKPVSAWADLFILPGHRFRTVRAMVTNFHLPRSTLLMLVSAFAGRERILAAYQEAIAHHYRFYSFGDAMFLL